MTTYTVRTPTTKVSVSSPTTRVQVASRGLPGRTGAPSPIPFHRSGVALPLVGKARFRFPFAATLIGVSAACAVPPTGKGIDFDLLLSGSVAGSFTLPDGSDEMAEESVALPVSVGDYVTVNITSVGSTTNGEDLTIFVRYTSTA